MLNTAISNSTSPNGGQRAVWKTQLMVVAKLPWLNCQAVRHPTLKTLEWLTDIIVPAKTSTRRIHHYCKPRNNTTATVVTAAEHQATQPGGWTLLPGRGGLSGKAGVPGCGRPLTGQGTLNVTPHHRVWWGCHWWVRSSSSFLTAGSNGEKNKWLN